MLKPRINLTPKGPPPVVVNGKGTGHGHGPVAHLLAAARRSGETVVARQLANAAPNAILGKGDPVVRSVAPGSGAPIRPAWCCVFCGHSLYVPQKVLIVRCPVCSKEISVEDVVLSGDVGRSQEIVTAGKIVVRVGARVAADLVGCTVEVSGKVLGDVLASTVCRVRCTAKMSGRIICRQLIIEPGAEVIGVVETITG